MRGLGRGMVAHAGAVVVLALTSATATWAQEAAAEAENHGFKETDVFVLQAELLIRLKDYQGALEKVHYALEEAPDHTYALFYRGVARAASHDTASALINFRLVLRHAPAFADANPHQASI